jgi:SAM-dependent methyltransferase
MLSPAPTAHQIVQANPRATGFLLAAFFNSFLIFLIQPITAKLLLPLFGGNPSVWIACLCFFQGVLLIGYLTAHLIRDWSSSRQTALIGILFLAALVFLPFSRPETSVGPSPIITLFGILLSRFFLPVWLVSTLSPLLARRFADDPRDGASGNDPYLLFQAGNFGSMAALLMYPTVFEPRMELHTHAAIWTIGFALILLLAIILVSARKRVPGPETADPDHSPALIPPTDTPTPVLSQGSRRGRWLLYSFIPSSLLLGVTAHLTSDLAPVPLLWIIPLFLYLTGYFLAFSRTELLPYADLQQGSFPLLMALLVVVNLETVNPIWFPLGLHLTVFFLISLLFHRRLYQEKPPDREVTSFYLFIGLGGFLGGVFNSMVAPLIFRALVEYPLVLALAALFLPVDRARTAPQTLERGLGHVSFGVNVFLLLLVFQVIPERYHSLTHFFDYALPIFLVFSGLFVPWWFKVCVALAFLGVCHDVHSPPNVLQLHRSFYGAFQVAYNDEKTVNLLYHGSTNHGGQRRIGNERNRPMFYYYHKGPTGDIFRGFRARKDLAPVAIVGLGTGGLASYALPGQRYVFYEIDPAIADLAKNADLFTYLRDSPGFCEIRIGDGRLEIAKDPDNTFGLVVLDAYSSDAIPVHLLTREAFELYRRKLRKDGVLVFHISNRYLNLEPILGNLCREAGWHGYTFNFDPDKVKLPTNDIPFVYGSTWIVMAPYKYNFGTILEKEAWRSVRSSNFVKTWTDSYTNLLPVFKWN